MEILTVNEVASMLKMSRKQIYTMTEKRTRNGVMKEHPLPVLKINGNLRFLRSDIEEWLKNLKAQRT